MEQIYTPTKDYKVLVRCFTYNQSKYIEDALNGFAMQKTDFPFVCLVMDDASTDGEQEVIKAWMERECDMENAENIEIEKSFITLVPHKSNLNCHFAFYFLKQNLYGTGEKKMCMVTPWREHCEYEALCEGDDYWIHPGKLQMQAYVLDEHNELDMCACATQCIKDDRIVGTISPSVEERILSTEETIIGGGGFLGTNSLMFRISLYDDDMKFWRYMQYDYTLQIHGSLRGGIYFLPLEMAKYRMFASGSWTSAISQDKKKFYEHRKKQIHTFELLDNDTKGIFNYAIEKVLSEFYVDAFFSGLSVGIFNLALKNRPLKTRLHYIFSLLSRLF